MTVVLAKFSKGGKPGQASTPVDKSILNVFPGLQKKRLFSSIRKSLAKV
jgi:hypothetical protein